MDRAPLERMLGQGLSLAEIGRRLGRHPSTVGYWVQQYGLQAVNRSKHAARGGLERDRLGALVETGMSIAEIAEELGRSKAAVRHWLAKYALKTRGGTRRRSREAIAEGRAARDAGLAEAVVECPRHGRCAHIRDSRGYLRCRRCRQEAVIRRRRRVKEILIREAGGRCRLCGYDRCVAALEFHHLDPAAKEFGIAQRGARSIDRLRIEVRKCVLLCSNCHAEVESGASSLSGVAQLNSPG
ncbi:MAG TPA: helix-turn-helix domain-containing protein [Solirubrobacteraceae bacterium]|nr:helix-turn-helix domain-containing protein [Solirubrobacteraceae bacterium]